MKKVVKFGGSSLASADQFKKVGAIILEDENRRYVVPSAPGKRFSSDTKVTDMLYACYDTAVKGDDFSVQLENIKARYQEIIDGLALDCSLDEDFEIIRKILAEAKHRVIAEGNINTPEKARRVVELGCYSVVVGSIITRPQLITKSFTDEMAKAECK